PGELILWEARTGRELLSLKDGIRALHGVAWSPDGRRLAAASSDRLYWMNPGEVKVWDAQTGTELLTLRGHTRLVWNVAFSPDGQRLASSSRDGTARVWDSDSGQELLCLQAGPPDVEMPDVEAVAFSP